MMTLWDGFQIEDPEMFVPWASDEAMLSALLPRRLRTVTTGYFTLDCTSLTGLAHVLGLHMTPREQGHLHGLEFFRMDPHDSSDDQETLAQSFSVWQHHLQLTFGEPTATSAGDLDLPSHVWQVGGATVRHFCQYRFGPEQHVRIARF